MQFSFEQFSHKRSSSVLMNRNKYVSPVQTNVCLIIHGMCQFYVFPFFNNMLVFNNGLSMFSINKICRYFANAPLAAHVHLFCFVYKELNNKYGHKWFCVYAQKVPVHILRCFIRYEMLMMRGYMT